ncbi:hypothetical protein [Methylocucumis oryzae]|uniref:Uncharacterized protein n=1 Tax=Methylocucumis oryzae TaxID=1632867 RepID=A0A0F3IG11_9GAMM|nr:hypothetical protein [Methylocucumis oryzae]KJV05681.1 hypothetical protein VZ94_16350 [Methylocucumis oryzae]
MFIFLVITSLLKKNIKTIQSIAKHQLSHLALREADGVNHQLSTISYAATYLQAFAAKVMSNSGNSVVMDEPSRFAFSPSGAYYTIKDTGASAVYFSGVFSHR